MRPPMPAPPPDRPIPFIEFPPELPISARADDIAAAVAKHPVVIVAGATGSGKTTQLPKIVRRMGRGGRRLIGVTQPRRIAATSVAARVASELGTPLGADVGYQIRFEDRSGPDTAIKFMTDGILLAEIHGDPDLRRYDTLILDEAHERSLTIDFLLGWIKRLLPRRPDLKVIVSSATLETERFSAFFDGAPVIAVEGRTFPVDVLYQPPADDADLADAVADAVVDVTSLDPRGDILVFLPGEREIREAENALAARALRHTVVQPLYARLSAAEQSRVFATIAGRRVILATNVAETSVTIPGIVYVVDTGVARLSRYDPRSGTTRLQIEAVSQASADQRKGRCGRVRDGVCVRLYDEDSFAARPAYTDPEIKRTGLAGVILRMKALDLGDVEAFPFLDPPQPRAITEGYRVLQELGALDAHRALTPLGKQLARFPVDPRIARMILAGAERGCLDDVLVVAAALNLQDPRERPRDALQRADEAHRKFRDEGSDFAGMLKLWAFVREAEARGGSALRRACKDNFLSYLRVREWRDIHRQLQDTVRELKLGRDAGRRSPRAPAPDAPAPTDAEARHEALHLALLTGLVSKVGQWHTQHRVYLGPRETRFALHPSSALAKKPPPWVMAFELVETAQLFARTVARIEPEWLLEAAPHLVKKSYGEPHWSERTARAMVRESATLYGMQIIKDRSVEYASVSPAQARLMFLDHALVRGEYSTRGAFQEKNRAVLERLARLRDRARRSDMVANNDAMLEFFDKRVSLDVVDGKGFEAWREKAEKANPNLLVFTLEDLLAGEPDLVPADYPEAITLHGVSCPLSYRFDPGADDDGVTVTVPLVLVPQILPGELDWTIPAWHVVKLSAVLNRAPKAVRKGLGSSTEMALTLAEALKPFSGPMLPALARAVTDLTGVDVAPEDLTVDGVAPYLRLTLRIVDAQGKTVAQGRDIPALLQRYGAPARAAWKDAAPTGQWERKGLTAWSFGALPPFITRRVGGIDVRSYPALLDRQTAVDLTLLESAAAAATANRAGVRRLVAIAARVPLNLAAARIPAALPALDGATLSRAEQDAFRAAVFVRIVEDAFGLGPGAELPRDKDAFDRVVREGSARVDPVARRWAEVLQGTAAELTKTLLALRTAARQPAGAAAMRDMRGQLEGLFPPTLLEAVPLVRMAHFPRYLKAMQVRLGRAVTDPRKDADKLAPFTPVWAAFAAKQAGARDAAGAEALRWALEELRVAIFAPELGAQGAVSLPKVAAAVTALR